MAYTNGQWRYYDGEKEGNTYEAQRRAAGTQNPEVPNASG